MKIELFTDGACRGNGVSDNPLSAIGVVLLIEDKSPVFMKEKLTFKPNTNNKAEIYAIIRGLDLIEDNYELTNGFAKDKLIIYSDSAYTINGITSWINSWRENGWVNSKKEPVKNQDLWQFLDKRLDYFRKFFDIEFIKVKGHSDNKWNNKCDQLANEAMDEEAHWKGEL